ncbi:hypothetical protein GCM10017674_80180 [Streptomyces gardneri]|uniref:Uncharacterized protein n=1 Tax=Streptomyces gardneri TaxID=66892 RepID=A0A4Y3RZ83_9ACTN|nr:hypothetical protein SGA01_77020 [Streptomyces gardneri]GHH23515.1 hypothetical protein GCM10017674_80180 [Streptomyces gardneri]
MPTAIRSPGGAEPIAALKFTVPLENTASSKCTLPRENKPFKTVSYMVSCPLGWSWGVDVGNGLFRTDCGR